MTDTARPTYYLQIWEYEDKLMFNELQGNDAMQFWAKTDDQHVWLFSGKIAHIRVFTDNMSLTRADALKAAVSFVFGRYERTYVDLEKLEVRKESGEPIPNPPN